MVKIALQMKATMDNVKEFKSSGADFRWYLKFTCNHCGEMSGKWNYVSLNKFTLAQRGNVINHFVSKCKICSRENTVTILEDTIRPYTVDDEGKFKTIVSFDCRGIEPTEFSARDGWTIKACDDGKVFTDVDLSEGEWVEYCDTTHRAVGIYEIETKFERLK